MNPYYDWTDQQVIDELNRLYTAKTTAAGGGVSVVAGEGRRVEYTAVNTTSLDVQIRELSYIARQRGLPIGGRGGAIGVEIG